MKVNIKSISEKTGFSPATISNALNHKKGVNAQTAAEIFRVAKELGYISESSITKVKFVIYKRNGLIIDDTPFFSLLIDGFEKECRTLGYEMVICHLNRQDLDYEEQVEWLIQDSATAVVLLGTELMEDDIEVFRRASCPLLLLDYWVGDMSFNGVLTNNADAAKKAVDYFIRKGHREIGYLRGNFRIKPFRSRAVGYMAALQKQGLPVKNEYLVTLPTTLDGAYRGMKEFLQKKPQLPTAFFADDDMIALGSMKALQEMGYKIPEDISIIGFDDLPFCEIVVPRLTSMRVPKQEMGCMAARRIAEMIKDNNTIKTKIQICTEFVERDSVKDLNIKKAVNEL